MTKKDGKPCKKCGTSDWWNSGGCKMCERVYRQENPDKVAEKNRKFKEANREKLAEKSRRYYHENKERVSKAKKKYQQDDLARNVSWTKRYRARKTKNGGKFTQAEWRALCERYGNKCLCCGKDDVKLTCDHVIPVSHGGSSNIDNIQCLCHPCNCSKGDRHIDYRPYG